jgi:hypothetical protein
VGILIRYAAPKETSRDVNVKAKKGSATCRHNTGGLVNYSLVICPYCHAPYAVCRACHLGIDDHQCAQ